MAATKSTESSTKKKRGNPQNLIPWKPGQSGNPKGRKLGTRNRKTVMVEGLRKLADMHQTDPDDLELSIFAAAVPLALKGSLPHIQFVADAICGKLTDKIDVTSRGMTLTDLIRLADAKPAGGNKATS